MRHFGKLHARLYNEVVARKFSAIHFLYHLRTIIGRFPGGDVLPFTLVSSTYDLSRQVQYSE